LTLEPLNLANRKRFDISNGVAAGLVVVDVERSSAAARAGLRPGDVLLEIDRQKIDGVDRFREVWQKSRGPVLLLVHRGGNTIFLVVRR
jgi:S1-C subfamily serine protease